MVQGSITFVSEDGLHCKHFDELYEKDIEINCSSHVFLLLVTKLGQQMTYFGLTIVSV
jgi:hypothetical protein